VFVVKPIESSFFDGKRPWSRIKDRVLGAYLPPYLRKIQRLAHPIVIVDCFAGRGRFSDGTPGSPLIICQEIKQHAPTRATAYFINKRGAHHEALARTIKGFTDAGIAHLILGQSHNFLAELTRELTNESLFVYLDPFGIKGCTFTATKQLFARSDNACTEVLMTMSMPVLHRLAARRRHPLASPIISRFHALLDDVLGNVHWREIMYDEHLTSTEKEERVIAAYCDQLRQHTRYACSCPVRNRDDERVKYYIVFASRHVHALCLMNDIMLNAYQDHAFAQAKDDLPLLAPVIDDWRATRTTETRELPNIITAGVERAHGITRAQLWEQIAEQHFMQFREAEFRQAVQVLVGDGVLRSDPPARNGRLNDRTTIYVIVRRTPASLTKDVAVRRSS
jgi:three-Cys-motif partner protein